MLGCSVFIKACFDDGTLVIEEVAIESLLRCCLLETLLSLGIEKMFFEVFPSFFGLRFCVPVFTVVEVKTRAVNEIVCVVQDLLGGKRLIAICGKLNAVVNLGS